ncbi:MAG: glycosyl transferase family 51 [Micrococcales bacterium]|nr:glycosyl transferase family 51 [Micrococcales bacterium]
MTVPGDSRSTSRNGPAARNSGSTGQQSGRLSLLVAFLVTSVIAGVFAAGVAMPTVGAMSIAAKTAIDAFESYPTDLSDPVLPQRSTITDASGKRIAYLWEENRVSVPLKKVAQPMQDAIIAIEDSRFYEHNGVDVRGTVRALAANRSSGEIQQGGSTITQQYVKMIQLNNAKNKKAEAAAVERSVERKLREARYAIAVEKEKTKDEILEGYLNIAYFGSGAYGVEVASETYYRKPAAKLNIVESATLAGVVQQPGAFDPIRNPKASRERRDEVLRQMRKLGYISSAEYQEAVNTSVRKYLNPKELQNGCPTSASPYFCDYTLNYIRNESIFGTTKRERVTLLKTGGLTIKTTLDPQAQRSSQRAVESRVPIADPSNKAAAITMVQPGTGKVLSMAQNTEWGRKGAGKTSYNFNVRTAEGGTIGMQSGSTFKPFTLAAALEKGISPNTAITSPSLKTFYGFRDCDGYNFPPYTVKGGGGVETMYSGTRGSINTFFVGLEQMVSLCRQAEIAEAMGVRKGDGKKLNRVPSFVLGANEVVPLDMAGAYAAFANDGVWCKPNPIGSIRNLSGKKVYDFESQCRRVLTPYVADTITSLLQGPVGGGGTFPSANFGRPIAGKTGTTDSSSAVWFVGYTPQIAAAVWVGDPRGGYRYPLNNVVINGTYYSNVYGATIPGPIWRTAMSGAHSGIPIQSFGGGPQDFDVRLNQSDDKGGAKDEPDPLPTEPQAPVDPGAGAELDDFNLDELENLPDFSFD